MCLHYRNSSPKNIEGVSLSLLALLFDENGLHGLNWITFFELAHNKLQIIIPFVMLDHDIVDDG